ncbi:MAG TPA: PP2C family protein-serine/threonine phosphatase [Acidimicrobiales bacterium]|nr:PP2C family protein-serine/threonine phosphatase [Acidimicrobiales bacterium]
MDEVGTRRFDLAALLAAVEAVPPVEAVDVLARQLAKRVGATDVSLLIANFSGDAVVRMSHVTADGETRDGHNERAESLPLPGSPYEHVLQHQEELKVREVADGWQLLVPVTERGDAIGILEMTLRQAPDEEVIDYIGAAAHALAYVLIASRRHTDLFEWAQRDTPFSLAAEIQRRLLPSAYTVEGGPFTVAGWLEPAANVGGDTFDYSVDREYLYASLTDAMGHSTTAAMLATIAVGSLRNTRRSMASPAEQATAVNRALLECSDADQFVTGLVVRICLANGTLEVVNAGHPPPLLLRSGHGATLEFRPDTPFGVIDFEPTTHRVSLEPGDRLVLVTDGFLERNAVEVDITSTLLECQKRHARELVRELSNKVLLATGGDLRDDAAVLCIDWLGPSGSRDATAGASRARATRN